MSKIVFLVESLNKITNEDYKNLRTLYLPIIGSSSAIIYETLADLALTNEGQLFELNIFFQKTGLDANTFQNNLDKLEAVGLINTLEKKEDKIKIFSLLKPNDIYLFEKNPVLKNHLIKIIGYDEYDNIYQLNKKVNLNKVNYVNVSKKYQDVFPDFFNDSLDENEIMYDTLELNIKTYQNHEDNVLKLHATDFIKYITKRNPTTYDIQLVNSLLKLGFIDCSINLFIDFSILINKQISHAYILKIANDFSKRSINSFNEIRIELQNVIAYKNKNVKYSNQSFFKEWSIDKKILIENKNDYQQSSNNLDEIFTDEDIKGMF